MQCPVHFRYAPVRLCYGGVGAPTCPVRFRYGGVNLQFTKYLVPPIPGFCALSHKCIEIHECIDINSPVWLPDVS
jgi:hypothetical protein